MTRRIAVVLFASFALVAHASDEKTFDIPTRPGITERALILTPADATATVIMLAGDDGGLQLSPSGIVRSGLSANFLVRSRTLFAEQKLNVVVLDAPSDRQSKPYLVGFRQTAEHAQDLKAVIAWARSQWKVPAWIIGTSRGTQSAAFVATALQGSDAPDGVVLTSSILRDSWSRAVPKMPLEAIRIPVLVVHHEQDGCWLCKYEDVPSLMAKLDNAPRKEVIRITGGGDQGDPCQAYAHHGFFGIEGEVVQRIARWINQGK